MRDALLPHFGLETTPVTLDLERLREPIRIHGGRLMHVDHGPTLALLTAQALETDPVVETARLIDREFVIKAPIEAPPLVVSRDSRHERDKAECRRLERKR